MTTDKEQAARKRADLIARYWTPAPRPNSHQPTDDQDADKDRRLWETGDTHD
jgi:hypothetical protein